MNEKVLLIAAFLATSTLLLAPSVNAACNNTEALHTWDVTGGLFLTVNGGQTGAGGTFAYDTCLDDLDGDGIPDSDGDFDAALAGGIFPAGTHGADADLSGLSNCYGYDVATYPQAYDTVAHHGFGNGATYVAAGSISFTYSVGAEGPINAAIPCETDGIIDDTTPTDCGSGDTGFHGFPFGDSPATLGGNVDLLDPTIVVGDCNPWDGYVAGFINAGPVCTWTAPLLPDNLLTASCPYVSVPVSGTFSG